MNQSSAPAHNDTDLEFDSSPGATLASDAKPAATTSGAKKTHARQRREECNGLENKQPAY